MSESATQDQFISVPCAACGAEMLYDPESQGLKCNHCGNKKELPRASDMVIERSFSEAFSLSAAPRGFSVETKTFHCNNCGSNTAVDPDEVSFSCPFCGSTNVNEDAHKSKVIRPSGILPFVITREKALGAFRTWIGKGFFRPGKLKRLAKLDKINSVYLPFWTYDADTASHWTAQAGYHYYVTESYTDSNGNSQTRQVQKTRWVPVDGYYEQSFNDVLILASHGLKQRDSDRIAPYDLEEVVNYDSRFILGHQSEVYQKDVQEGYKVADDIMDNEIRSQVASRVPGDTHRSLNINTRKSGVTFKHILLPLWIAAYQFNNKTYRFTVNGQTGKIAGKKPLSWAKIIITILLAAGAITALALIFGGGGGEAAG